MTADHTKSPGELRFVDPSVDPSTLWDIGKSLAVPLIIKTAREILRRFPAVEYAVGFDGVDDWVCVDNLDIGRNGIDIEMKIWISQHNQSGRILGFSDSDGNSVLALSDTITGNSGIRAIYKNKNDIKSTVLSRIEPETWQDLRVWSDGNIFSIEVDGAQVSTISNISLENGPFKFYFGTGRRVRYFRGMVKSLQIQSGTSQLFNLQSGEGLKIEDKTNSAEIAGIHDMKKGRFQKEFCA